MIDLRKNPAYENIFVNGDITPILLEYDNLIAYKRGDNIAVICNFSDEVKTIKSPFKSKRLLLNNYENFIDGDEWTLEPWQAVVLEV